MPEAVSCGEQSQVEDGGEDKERGGGNRAGVEGHAYKHAV